MGGRAERDDAVLAHLRIIASSQKKSRSDVPRRHRRISAAPKSEDFFMKPEPSTNVKPDSGLQAAQPSGLRTRRERVGGSVASSGDGLSFPFFTRIDGETLLGRYFRAMSTPSRDTPTRERILITASELFARQGYAGTSTRQIASKVGMQQPSLFHHFSTKSAIMHELLRYSLEGPLRWKAILAETTASPATKLYCYVCLDVRHIVSSPYNIAGLDHDNVTKLDEFKRWLSALKELRTYRNGLVEEAVRTGEFITWPVDLLQGSISSIVLSLVQRERTIRIPMSRATEVAHCVASFLVRAMLSEPNDLPSIRARAEEIKATQIHLEDPRNLSVSRLQQA